MFEFLEIFTFSYEVQEVLLILIKSLVKRSNKSWN